ncbi:MAG: FAD-dependent oxidoreductase [Paracoccaceae bacterium]|nr:FAD-dependent oxidoreductase [Paracoccaceae bacterium]
MKKLLNAGIIKRDLSFPIYFQGYPIPANPGDTLASAILANSREQIMTSYPFSHKDYLTSMWGNPGHFFHVEGTKLAYSSCWLNQEVYPGFILDAERKRSDDESGQLKPNYFCTDLFRKELYETLQFPKKVLIKSLPWLSIGESADSGNKEKEKSMLLADIEHVSVELLVVGAGIAGLVAGLTASRAGIRLMILESDFMLGGRLNSEGENNNPWLMSTILELKNQENVRICNRTQFLRRDADGIFFAMEKFYKQDSVGNVQPIYKILKIKAEHTFVATGARERIPFLLDKNIPGIMPAGLFSTFLNRFGLGANEGVTLYTNNDAGWNTVKHLIRLGLRIDAVIDTRLNSTRVADCLVFRGAKIIKVLGKSHLRAVIIRDLQGRDTKIRTSLLAVSSGYETDYGMISQNIQNLEWCPRISSFKAHLNSSDLTLIGGANAVFCPKASIENAYKAACQLIKNRGLKVISGDLPYLDEENYECQLLGKDSGRFRQNWIGRLLDKNIADLVEPYNQIKKRHEKKINKLEEMELEALKMFSSDGEELSVLTSQTGNSCKNMSFSNTIYELSNSLFPICYAGTIVKEPFRTLPNHFEYEKLGVNWQKSGEWFVPAYFSRQNSSHKKKNIINLEIETTFNKVGISDLSDLVKIEIVGKYATNFIYESLDLERVDILVGECQEGFLVERDKVIIDHMMLLRTRDDKYILTAGNCNESRLYNYLNDKLLNKFPTLGVQINLITEVYQIYYLWGASAGKVLDSVLSLDSSVLKLRPMKLKTISSQDFKCLIYRCEERTTPSFRVFVSQSKSKQFFSQIEKIIQSYKGVVIGRCATEIMELENGLISGRRWQHFCESVELKESDETIIDEDDEKLFNQFLKFECFGKKQKHSRIAILYPIGPTKNIVEGSEVHSIGGLERDRIMGQVVASYFSKIQGKFIGYVCLNRAGNIKKKPVIVLNRGKDYQTQCELSSYDLIDTGT